MHVNFGIDNLPFTIYHLILCSKTQFNQSKTHLNYHPRIANPYIHYKWGFKHTNTVASRIHVKKPALFENRIQIVNRKRTSRSTSFVLCCGRKRVAAAGWAASAGKTRRKSGNRLRECFHLDIMMWFGSDFAWNRQQTQSRILNLKIRNVVEINVFNNIFAWWYN